MDDCKRYQSLLNQAVERLVDLGYDQITSEDYHTMQFLTSSVIQSICSVCNLESLSENLAHIAIDRICGRFFMLKKGASELSEKQQERAVRTVAIGDTSTTFEADTAASRFDFMVSQMVNAGEDEIIANRSLAW